MPSEKTRPAAHGSLHSARPQRTGTDLPINRPVRHIVRQRKGTKCRLKRRYAGFTDAQSETDMGTKTMAERRAPEAADGRGFAASGDQSWRTPSPSRAILAGPVSRHARGRSGG